MSSKLDGFQVLKEAFDDDKGGLKTSNLGTLVNEEFDYIGVVYPDGITEVYTYKSGGVSGSTVATVTVIYVDGTKEQLVSVTRI
jgi:hypothetical protein